MQDWRRIWLIHGLAFLAGLVVAWAAMWLLSAVLVSRSDDWVAALGKVLGSLFVAGPLGVAAYALIVTRMVPLRFGLRGWVTVVVLGVLAVVFWLGLAAYGLAEPTEGLVLTGVVLFVVGGIACTRLARNGAP